MIYHRGEFLSACECKIYDEKVTYVTFFSRNPIHVNLAMQCIANIGSKDMAEAFGYDIPKLLVSG